MSNRLLTLSVSVAVIAALAWVYASRHAAPAPDPKAPAIGSPSQPAGDRALSQQPVTVMTAAVEQVPLAVEIEALGTARANEAVEVTSKTSNTVAAVRFEEGQKVARGAVLVELDGTQARADLAVAEAALDESRSTFKRSRDLHARQALSESQLEQIEATFKANEARVASARARVSDTVVRAPFSGRVGLRRVSVGGLISPGMVITTLDDTSVMKVDFEVPETFIAMLESGLDIEAVSIAYPGRVFAGAVASVDSRVDPVARSVTVRADVPNAEGLLKPGMFLSVRLTREPSPALVVPESALVPERGAVFVFVVKDGIATQREVIIGRRQPGRVELLSGASLGDRVVVQGTQKIRDGGPVSEASVGPSVDSP
jgi:membrane fusion protein (multidrug efflux system)